MLLVLGQKCIFKIANLNTVELLQGQEYHDTV